MYQITFNFPFAPMTYFNCQYKENCSKVYKIFPQSQTISAYNDNVCASAHFSCLASCWQTDFDPEITKRSTHNLLGQSYWAN